MPTGIEVTKVALDDFKKIQEYMLLAKKENATETYAKLKDEYLTIKALLQVSGVNLTDIDKIKQQGNSQGFLPWLFPYFRSYTR